MLLWRDVTHWWEFVVENFIDISTLTFYHQSTLENELINSFKNYNIFLLKNLQNINPNCSIATYALARVFGKNISQNFSTLFITLINTFLPRFGVLLTVEKGVFRDVVWIKNIRHYPTRTKVSGDGNPPVKGEYLALNLVEDPLRHLRCRGMTYI